ncbi:response regulator transcription factor [Chloroflexota bacterium]
MEIEPRILWIEGRRAVSPSFIPGLRSKGYHIEIVSTGVEALSRLSDTDPDLVVVNAASMRTTGKRICQSINGQSDGTPVVLITDRDLKETRTIQADVVLTLPFTTRKLVNRITPLLPGDDKNLLRAGPIRLDLDKKRVKCDSREANLTPRLVQLLKLMMENPNEVIERSKIFRKVWETDYTVDTRTLDVHMSWLRKAIEKDPRNPKFLITIRGMGYRLDV